MYLRKWQTRHLIGPVFMLSEFHIKFLQINLLCIAASFDDTAWQSSGILSSLSTVPTVSNETSADYLMFPSAVLLFKIMCSGVRETRMWWGHSLKFRIILRGKARGKRRKRAGTPGIWYWWKWGRLGVFICKHNIPDAESVLPCCMNRAALQGRNIL